MGRKQESWERPQMTTWRQSRTTPTSLLPILFLAMVIALAVAAVFSESLLVPVGGLVLLVLAAVGFGPLRSHAGRSTDSPDSGQTWIESEMTKPSNEGDLL